MSFITSNSKNLVVFTLFVFIIFAIVSGCSSAPADIAQAATDLVEHDPNTVSVWELSGVEITCSTKIDLTPADKAEGITEAWCIDVSFAKRA